MIKIGKKALTAAIMLSLVLGTYGVAGAKSENNHVVTKNGGTVTEIDGGVVSSDDESSTEDAEASYNTVTVNDVTVLNMWGAGGIYGSYVSVRGTGAITANSNKVEVTSGSVGSTIHAGFACSYNRETTAAGDVSNNTIKLNNVTVGNSERKGEIYGGRVITEGSGGTTKANENQVGILSGNLRSDVYGGYADGANMNSESSQNAEANGNTVTLSSDAEVSGTIYGAMANTSGSGSSATANDNHVEITGGSTYFIYGAKAQIQNTDNTKIVEVSNNTVTLNSDVAVGATIYGAMADTNGSGSAAIALSNEVNMTGGSVYSVYGAYARASSENNSAGAQAISNIVKLNGVAVGQYVYGGIAYTYGYGSGVAISNQVEMTGGSVGNDVNGGYVDVSPREATAESSNNNIVKLNDVAVSGNVYGGQTYTNQCDAISNENQVEITGGSVAVNIYGGRAKIDFSGSTVSDEAIGNTVTLNADVTVSGAVYGGCAITTGKGAATANNNTVNLGGSYDSMTKTVSLSDADKWSKADLTKATLFGGYAESQNGGESTSEGNTLNVFRPVTVNKIGTNTISDTEISSFQNINFYIPGIASSDTAMLTVTEDFDGNGVTLNTVTSYTDSNNNKVTYNGDTIILLQSNGTLSNFTQYQIDGETLSDVNETKAVDITRTGITNLQAVVGYSVDTTNNTITFGTNNYKLGGTADITGTVELDKVLDGNMCDMNIASVCSLSLTKGMTNAGSIVNDGTLKLSDTSSASSISGIGSTEIIDGTTTIGGSFTQNSLTIDSGAVFEADGAVTVNDTVSNSGVMTVKSDFTADSMTNSGTYTQTGGSFKVNDALSNSGVMTVKSDFTADSLTNSGTYNQTGGSFTVNNDITNIGTINLSDVNAIALKCTASINSISGTVADLKLTVPSGLSGAQLTVTDSALNIGTLDTDITNYIGRDLLLISDAQGVNISSFKINGVAGSTKDVDAGIPGMTNVSAQIGYTVNDAKTTVTFGSVGHLHLNGDSDVTSEIRLYKALDAKNYGVNIDSVSSLYVTKGMTNAGAVVNDGTLMLSDTSSASSISGTGITKITGGTAKVSGSFAQNFLAVDSGASFEVDGATTVNDTVYNSGKMTVKSDFTADSLTNSGTYNQTGGSFTVSNDVTNSGTINLSGVSTIALKGTASINSISGTVADLKLTVPSGLSGAQLTVTDSALNIGTLDTDITNYTGSDLLLISDAKGININSFKINGVAGSTKDMDANVTGITNIYALVGYILNDANTTVTFGTKCYKLSDEAEILDDATLDNILDLSGQTVNMQLAETASSVYNTVTVPKLTGTGNLSIDVDLSGASAQNDKLIITGTGSDANLNISSILLRGDGLTVDTTAYDAITYVEASGSGDISGINYTVGGTAGLLQSANIDYIYTFRAGSSGKLNVTKEFTASKVADFIQGTGSFADVSSLDINRDIHTENALGTTATAESAGSRSKNLTLGIDAGKTLSAVTRVDGITVAEDYSLNLQGQTADTAVATITGFETALTNNGTLKVSNLTMTDNTTDLVNNGTAKLESVVANTVANESVLKTAGTTNITDISGTGTTEISGGTTTVSSAFTQNGLTVDSGASYVQNGGSFVVNGDVTNNGSVSLHNLGGEAGTTTADAQNKITGKLTNNGTFTLDKATHLTVGAFSGEGVEVVGNSSFTVEGGATTGKVVIAKDSSFGLGAESNITSITGEDRASSIAKVTAGNLMQSYIGKVNNATVEVSNTAGVSKIQQANDNDAVFARLTNAPGAEPSTIGKLTNSTVNINEGAIVGDSILSYDADGNMTTQEKSNQHNTRLVESLSNSVGFARIEMNDIRRRLGDVRINKAENGIWVRYENGKNAGMGIDQHFNKIQIGADTAVSDTWRVGGAFTYTKGSASYGVGSNDTRTYSGAAYGVYSGKNGEFMDIIGRVGMDKTDINALYAKGDFNTLSFALSAEVGKTYGFAKNFFVEPQAELTYTNTGSDSFRYDGRLYDLQTSNSFIGRLGFALGYKAPENNGCIYTRFSVLHEFAGDKELQVSNGTLFRSNIVDGKQSWWEWAIGGQINTSKSTYIYADVEKTFHADINEKYRLNIGMRYSF